MKNPTRKTKRQKRRTVDYCTGRAPFSPLSKLIYSVFEALCVTRLLFDCSSFFFSPWSFLHMMFYPKLHCRMNNFLVRFNFSLETTWKHDQSESEKLEFSYSAAVWRIPHLRTAKLSRAYTCREDTTSRARSSSKLYDRMRSGR